MQLNVYISSAADGIFRLKAAELPELTAQARELEDIPAAVRSAAAALTGREPGDFDITIDY
ncbi:hypothetical protein AB0284_17540 [Pseudarthrobacter phenanthrenivorans]|uniref:hypothetical protein n=1 Tax=Pseudarthrobacter phenanthrenivorans TaxID=361575 RepID=UPI00344C8141